MNSIPPGGIPCEACGGDHTVTKSAGAPGITRTRKCQWCVLGVMSREQYSQWVMWTAHKREKKSE